jgi:Arc/MetJ-type ribon-helix-helix transcriptional regulator
MSSKDSLEGARQRYESLLQKSGGKIVRLSPDHKRKINQLVEANPDRFRDADDFIFRAIDVFLAWEKNPVKTIEKLTDMEPTMLQFAFMQSVMASDMLKQIYPGYPEKYGDAWDQFSNSIPNANMVESELGREEALEPNNEFERINSNLTTSREYVKQINFKEITKEGYDNVKFDGWPLLFTHYSRLLPVKIAICLLGNMMREQKLPVVKFYDFRHNAYDLTESISKRLTVYEKENKKKREEKISTGLPRPYISSEITAKQALAEQRYKDRYFGKLKKSQDSGETTFEGALMALGVIKIFVKKKEVLITLTDLGKKFYLLDNPIISGMNFPAFSNEEREFLVTKIIPNRPLETKLIKTATEIITYEDALSTDITDTLDKEFENTLKNFVKSSNDKKFTDKIQRDIIDKTTEIKENNDGKQTPVEACRIATMGRLTELGVVSWDINRDGKSEYEISDKELAASIKKL